MKIFMVLSQKAMHLFSEFLLLNYLLNDITKPFFFNLMIVKSVIVYNLPYFEKREKRLLSTLRYIYRNDFIST